MKLSIIIPVLNNWVYTRYVLENLKNLSSDYEIIVVDNASTDDTKVHLPFYSQKFKNIKFIKNTTNLGFGYACNQAYEICKGNIVLFLNNDIKINDKSLNFLHKLVEDINNTEHAALFGPTGGYVDPQDNFNFKYETEDPNQKINYMSGWFLAAKRIVFDQLIVGNNKGPFDAETYYVYFEDTDVSMLASQKGIKFQLYPVPVVHLGKKTSSMLDTGKLYLESKPKFINKWKHLLTSNK